MLGWIFIIFCFFGLLISGYGILLHGASFIEKRIGAPFYERLSEGGRKNYWRFVLLALPICFVYKILSRAPIWLMFYFIFSYVGVGDTLIYQFLGFLIFAGALSKVAEEGNYYFPKETKLTKREMAETDELVARMHRTLYPEQYKQNK